MRVATWNIRAAIGPGPFPDRWWRRIDPDRLHEIGAAIADLDVDVVALQEVAVVSRDGELVDTAGDLARQLDVSLRYAATRSFEVLEDGVLRGVGTFGNALLSRIPLRSVRCVALPQAAAEALVEQPGARHPVTGAPHPAAGVRYADAPATIREPRCLLVAQVAGVTVGSTHFSHIGAGERRLQAEAVAAALGAGPAAVLLGDLNSAIDAPELAPLSGWTDAFAEPPGDPARVTTDDGLLIDQVLGRGSVVVGGARVDRRAAGLSDHVPVVATVAIDEDGLRHSPYAHRAG